MEATALELGLFRQSVMDTTRLTTATKSERADALPMSRRPHIGIFSRSSDIHAIAIQSEVCALFPDVDCSFVPVDAIHSSGHIHWSGPNDPQGGCLPTNSVDREVSVEALDLIWWRRTALKQAGTEGLAEQHHRELVDNDCAAAIIGMTTTYFTGTWVSHPTSTRQAENKILQLQTAAECGLRVPRTIVTQNPQKLAAFLDSLHVPVVVKCLRGSPHFGTPTSIFPPDFLINEAAIRSSPAIYQEYIPGSRHLRVHCFGEQVLTASIDSEECDWRGNLSVPFGRFDLPTEVGTMVLETLRRLGLRIGVVDLKLTPAGEFVWFEVNPQGQFLFVEALVPELRLTNALATYLGNEAIIASELRRASFFDRAN